MSPIRLPLSQGARSESKNIRRMEALCMVLTAKLMRQVISNLEVKEVREDRDRDGVRWFGNPPGGRKG